MTDVRMPDGAVVRFPDDMPKEQIRAMIAKKFPEVAEPTARERYDAMPAWQKPLQAADDMVRLFANGVSFGMADRLAGLTEGGEAAARARSQEARDRAGPAGFVAEVGGSMLPATKLANAGVTAARFVPKALTGARGLLARTGAMAVDGAALGAATAAGYGEDPVQGAKSGALWGGLGNVAGEGVGKVVGSVSRKIARARNPAPSTEQIRREAADLADFARNSGVGVSSTNYTRAVRDLGDVLDDTVMMRQMPERFATQHKKLARLWNMLDEHTKFGDFTIDQFDMLHRDISQTARDLARKGKTVDTRAAYVMLKKLDELIETPGFLSGTNRSDAANAYLRAKSLFNRAYKADEIENVFEYALDKVGANYTEAGFQTALRQEFRRLKRSPVWGKFNAAEQAAMDEVIRGGPFENALRRIGKYAPTGLLSGMAGVGVWALGGPGVGVPYVAGTHGAKALSTKYGVEAAERVSDMVHRGAELKTPPGTLTKYLIEHDRRAQVIRALLAGGLTASTVAE